MVFSVRNLWKLVKWKPKEVADLKSALQQIKQYNRVLGPH